MLIFVAQINAENVERYMASVMLPPYFHNLKLERISFESQNQGASRCEPLRLRYSLPGRVEDFFLNPREHAIPLLKTAYPKIESRYVRLLDDSPIWRFRKDQMLIYFTSCETCLEPSPEALASTESFISISRHQVYLAISTFRQYVEEMYLQMGIELPTDAKICWDDSVGGIRYVASPISIQLEISDEKSLNDIMNFANLLALLDQVNPWAGLDFEEIQNNTVQISESGITFPLKERH